MGFVTDEPLIETSELMIALAAMGPKNMKEGGPLG